MARLFFCAKRYADRVRMDGENRTVRDQTVTFVKRTSVWGKNRMLITLPPEVADLIHPGQKYEVQMRPVGTICVVKR